MDFDVLVIGAGAGGLLTAAWSPALSSTGAASGLRSRPGW